LGSNDKKKPTIEKAEKLSVITTSNFSALWNDKGSGAWLDATFYRPTADANYFDYFPIGHYGQRNYDFPKGSVQMVQYDGGNLTAKPDGYELVWDDRGSRADSEGSFWRPIAPAGFVAIGHLVQSGRSAPSRDAMLVIHSSCAVRCDPWLLWSDKCSGARDDVSIWSVAETTSPSPGVFVAVEGYNRPASADNAFWCIDPSCIARFP